jgi:hypothetical protein
MLRSKSFRRPVVLIVATMGIVVVAVTGGFLLNRRTEGTPPAPSAPPFADRPHIAPQPLGQKATLDIPELIADRAKPVFTGPLGDFLVIPRVSADSPPCPEPRKRVENYKNHELYSHISGAGIKAYVCANGIVLPILEDYNGGGQGKWYFVGSAKVPFEAPRERLTLLTIGGRPAIAELPIPGLPPHLRIAAIERFPTSDLPGIMVAIDNTPMSLKDAVAVLAQMMGMRPHTGPLGNFLVTPGAGADSPPCPAPSKRAENYKSHELYSPFLGEDLVVYECANGMIRYVGPGDYAGPSKSYFVGPAKVPYNALRDRLVLLTIGGHPAIAELPTSGLSSNLSIVAIERFPTSQLPGIMVAIYDKPMSLEDATAIVARIMGVQP